MAFGMVFGSLRYEPSLGHSVAFGRAFGTAFSSLRWPSETFGIALGNYRDPTK